MALTPQDVQQKLFTTVRLREGYETSEVDEFCEEVEAELTRLLKEIDDLHSQLASAGQAPAATSIADGERATSPAGEPAARTAAPPEIVVRTSGEVGAAAARMLEMAQRMADEYLAEERAEAERLVTEARGTAEKLTADARAKADEVDRETHERTTALEQQIAEQRQEALDRLQEEKRRLEQEAETLRSFEREYRGRLRAFLESQLGQLTAHDSGDTPLAPAGAPSRPGNGETSADPGEDSEGGPAGGGAAASPGGEGGTAATSDGWSGDSRSEGDAGSAPADDGATTGHPRSAFGRILEEEERDASR